MLNILYYNRFLFIMSSLGDSVERWLIHENYPMNKIQSDDDILTTKERVCRNNSLLVS